MSERYSRLFALPENLYATGSPVVIAAGTLLKDNQTGKVLAQLKLQSISNKTIIGVKVRLCLFDNAGNSISLPVDFDYLDLSASRDSEFGQKTPVALAENKARSYTVAVQEVVFADKTTWTSADASWNPLPRPKTLDAVLYDAELVKQYKIAVGSNFAYYPLEEKDLWYCACGALNHEGEACHECHRTLFELQMVDMAALEAEKVARLAKEAKEEAEAKAAADIQKQKNKKTLGIVAAAACVIVLVVVLMVTVVIPTMEANAEQNRLKAEYSEAVALMEAGEYESAIAAFAALGDYEDSSKRITDCNTAIVEAEAAKAEAERLAAYENAEALVNSGELAKAAIEFGKLVDYRDAWQCSLSLWRECIKPKSICGGDYHTVGLKSDGTVVVVGLNKYGLYDVGGWKDIVAISADYIHTVGLKADGTVVAVGGNSYGQCDVSGWKDIVAISAGIWHTMGLKADGTVVAVGDNRVDQCNVSGWKNIVAITAGNVHNVALKADGTVVAVGLNDYGQCDVSGWRDIVAITAGYGHTVGLKADGTVVATGVNKFGQCNVSGWKDIVAITACGYHTVGLKADGTVVAVGCNDYGQCNVSGWKDIVDIQAGKDHTVGLKTDGTVVAVGCNDYGQCDVSSWTNIKLPN